jgi:hypothetical protein
VLIPQSGNTKTINPPSKIGTNKKQGPSKCPKNQNKNRHK